MRAPRTMLLGRRLLSLKDLLRPRVDKTTRLGRKKSNQIQCLVEEHVLAYDWTWKIGVVVDGIGTTSYMWYKCAVR